MQDKPLQEEVEVMLKKENSKNNVVDISTGLTGQESLTRYMQEVKVVLKSKSKNELIRTVGALLLDNYALKEKIATLMPKPEATEAKSE